METFIRNLYTEYLHSQMARPNLRYTVQEDSQNMKITSDTLDLERPTTIADIFVGGLRSAIHAREFSPSEHLRPSEFAVAQGVSRIPLRGVDCRTSRALGESRERCLSPSSNRDVHWMTKRIRA